MSAFLFYLQSPSTPSAEMWEIAKGVMLSLVTFGVAYLVRTIRTLEFEVRDIRADVKVAQSGEQVLHKAAHEQDRRLDALEDWKTALDTVAKVERELWGGEERRQDARRLRDKVMLNRAISDEE